jgi:hypothetical protein
MSNLWAVDRKTRSYTYIFPMLGSNRHEFTNVENCYIGDNSNPDIKNHIFLLLRNEKNSNKIHEILEIDSNYAGHYNVSDSYTMYYFRIPEKWRPSYHLFKMGKYFKFPDDYKRHILKFHNTNNKGPVGRVLYKSEKLFKEWEKIIGVKIDRSQDIGTLPDLENAEIFSIEMLMVPSKVDKI